jgi:hypothetical protein
MSAAQLRKVIKKNVDRLPVERLASPADDVEFLSRPTLLERIAEAEREVRAGKGTPWRRLRSAPPEHL